MLAQSKCSINTLFVYLFEFPGRSLERRNFVCVSNSTVNSQGLAYSSSWILIELMNRWMDEYIRLKEENAMHPQISWIATGFQCLDCRSHLWLFSTFPTLYLWSLSSQWPSPRSVTSLRLIPDSVGHALFCLKMWNIVCRSGSSVMFFHLDSVSPELSRNLERSSIM